MQTYTTPAPTRYDLGLIPQELRKAAQRLAGHTPPSAQHPAPSTLLAEQAAWRSRTAWSLQPQPVQQQRLERLAAATLHTRCAERGLWLNPAHMPRVVIRSQSRSPWPWSRQATAVAAAIHLRTAVPVDA